MTEMHPVSLPPVFFYPLPFTPPLFCQGTFGPKCSHERSRHHRRYPKRPPSRDTQLSRGNSTRSTRGSSSGHERGHGHSNHKKLNGGGSGGGCILRVLVRVRAQVRVQVQVGAWVWARWIYWTMGGWWTSYRYSRTSSAESRTYWYGLQCKQAGCTYPWSVNTILHDDKRFAPCFK